MRLRRGLAPLLLLLGGGVLLAGLAVSTVLITRETRTRTKASAVACITAGNNCYPSTWASWACMRNGASTLITDSSMSCEPVLGAQNEPVNRVCCGTNLPGATPTPPPPATYPYLTPTPTRIPTAYPTTLVTQVSCKRQSLAVSLLPTVAVSGKTTALTVVVKNMDSGTNCSPATNIAIANVVGPLNWRFSFPDKPVSVNAQTAVPLHLSATVPMQTASGTYRIELTVGADSAHRLPGPVVLDVKAQKPLPTPTPQTPQAFPCKTGVNSFGVDQNTLCGDSSLGPLYKSASYRCYDGYSGKVDKAGTCIPSSQLESLAKLMCEGRSNCTVPTPTPGSATPTPIPNYPPLISGINPSSVRVATYYKGSFDVVDNNPTDVLQATVTSKPYGWSVNCAKLSNINSLRCTVAGWAWPGAQYIKLSATDGKLRRDFTQKVTVYSPWTSPATDL